MNILIAHNGAPDSRGLILLREAVRSVHRDCHVTVLTPSEGRHPFQGAASTGLDLDMIQPHDLRMIDANHYSIPKATLSDSLDFAHLHPDFWLSRGGFDLTLIGIDVGYLTGIPDVMRTTTAAAGLLCATAYGTPVHVLMQRPSAQADPFAHAAEQAVQALKRVGPGAGECWVSSLAPTKPTGEAFPPLAHYSGYRRPPVTVVPRAREEKYAVTYQQEGYLTHTKLTLRVNPELRY